MRPLISQMPSSIPSHPFVTPLPFGIPTVINQHLPLPPRWLLQFSPVIFQRRKIACWSSPRHNIPYQSRQVQGSPTNLRLVRQLQWCDYKTNYLHHIQGCTPRRLPQKLIPLHTIPGPTCKLQSHLLLSSQVPNYRKPSQPRLPKIPNGTSPRTYYPFGPLLLQPLTQWSYMLRWVSPLNTASSITI